MRKWSIQMDSPIASRPFGYDQVQMDGSAWSIRTQAGKKCPGEVRRCKRAIQGDRSAPEQDKVQENLSWFGSGERVSTLGLKGSQFDSGQKHLLWLQF